MSLKTVWVLTHCQILLFLSFQCLCALSSSPSLERAQDTAIIDNHNNPQTVRIFVCWERLTCGLCVLPLNFPSYLFSLGAFKTIEWLKSYTPDPWWWISAPTPHTHTLLSRVWILSLSLTLSRSTWKAFSLSPYDTLSFSPIICSCHFCANAFSFLSQLFFHYLFWIDSHTKTRREECSDNVFVFAD